MHTFLLEIKMSGEQYHLELVNDSNQEWTFYVYQKAPERTHEKIFSLAWLVSPFKVRVGDHINFDWSIDYQFVWSSSGTLMPGVVFRAGGEKPCKPSGKNHTKFSAPVGKAPGLSDAFKGGDQGTLCIEDGEYVPPDTFSVGIGMSGNGTFVDQAGPNLTHLFTPTPNYWVAAGREVKIGTVLDIQTVTKTDQVIFDHNVYSMKATLTQSNEWEIKKAKFSVRDAPTGAATTTTTTNTTHKHSTVNCCALI